MPKVTIAQNILAVNEHVAQEIRQSLSARGIRALNIMSSPGAGKTTLLEWSAPLSDCAGVSASA
jgi:hydrogenase nickel incorporation protein HypB